MNTGNILLPDFRRVLDNFCCKLTDAQFKHVASKLPMNRNGSVDYVNYIESFKLSDNVSNNLRSFSAESHMLAEITLTLYQHKVQNKQIYPISFKI